MPLCELLYRSEVLQKQTTVRVILPSYKIPAPYHVMFLLHGLSDNHTIWTRYTSIERYVDGLPLIVVMPDTDRGWYTDAVEGAPYYSAIAVELPEIIRHYFPTKPGWCATGLSMGGYGAAKLALTRPELFVSGVSHSGALGFGHQDRYFEDDRSPEFRRILGDSSKGGINDLYAQAEGLTPSQRPKLRIDCGVDDFLLEDNRAFIAHLNEIGFAHEYEEFPGAHDWSYWDLHVQDALRFHARNLGISK